MEEKNFRQFMDLKRLSTGTQNQYMIYFRMFNPKPQTQESVDAFLVEHNNTVARAFLRNYMDCSGNTALKIVKIRGCVLKKPVGVLSRDKVMEMVDAADDDYTKLAIRLMFEGGLRVSELCGLRLKDVDLGKCSLIAIGKRQKRITARFTMVTRDLINGLHAGDDLETLIMPFTRFQIWHRINLLGRQVFGEDARIHPHVFRHSCASFLWEQTRDIVKVKEYLNHESIATTDRYTHITDKEEVNRMWEAAFT